MLRPRSILWVDDEIETLDSQVMFLEQQGFAVERVTNGDDALVLLRGRPFGVVLLDEQMPGTRGLDLVPRIRAIDAAMPVVMVTKSEEPDTMRDAIGAEIADYLIRPRMDSCRRPAVSVQATGISIVCSKATGFGSSDSRATS